MKARKQKRAREQTTLAMILHCKAKSWDARQRRSKDARRRRAEME